MNKNFTSPAFSEFVEENVKSLTDKMLWMRSRTFKCAESLEEVRDFVDRAIRAGKCVVDLETTGLNTRMKNKPDPITGKPIKVPITDIVGVGLCFDSSFGLYIPIAHRIDPELNLPEKPILEEVQRLCTSCITIYHNAKFDVSMLKNRGMKIDNYKMIEDTQILTRLYDIGRKVVGLKMVSKEVLGQPMLELKDLTGEGLHFDMVSPKIGYIYGASDAICTMDLYNFYIQQKIIQEQKLIYDLEKRVIFVVIEIESNLIKIDIPYLEQIRTETEKQVRAIEKEIQTFAGREINIGSPLQMGKFLFEEKGYRYPLKEKTKTDQFKTDDATLELIEDEYPIVKKIVHYRGLEKSLGTYTLRLLENHDDENCIKLGFNQSGTDTGRFSSPGGDGISTDGYSGVNVQSTPKDVSDEMPDMRRAFIPRPGKKFVAIDYENEEMRVAANISNETKWINDIANGIDFHTSTGSAIFKVDPKDLKPEQRKTGKIINFLSMYGGGSRGLSAKAHMSEMEARRTLQAFFEGVPKFKRWRDSTISSARKLKYAKTAFGRIRDLSNAYNSGDKALEAHADRCAPNHVIQGSSADIMKTIMAKLYAWIHRNNLEEDIKILITMHDELVFEITEDKLELLVPEIAKIMMLKEVIQGMLKWPIPLTVDVKYGDSWRVKKKFFEEFPHTKKRLDEPLMEFQPGDVSKSAGVITTPAPATTPSPVITPVPTTTTSAPVTTPVPTTTTPAPALNTTPAAEVILGTPAMTTPAPVSEIESIEDLLAGIVIPVENKPASVAKIMPEPDLGAPVPIAAAPAADLTLTDPSQPENGFGREYLVYTLSNLKDSTRRNLNEILIFLRKENERSSGRYLSDKKILRLRAPGGDILNVEDMKVNADVFLGLARYFGL